MLRIIDARTGEPVTAAPARRGPARIEAHVPARDTTGLRVLLVADLLARAPELGGTPVLPVPTGDREEAEPRADAAALGSRPPEDGRDAGAGPRGARTVHVVAEGAAAPDGVRIAVAPVGPAAPADDPLDLRAALLADGARFETYACADRFLGLELTRDIGAPQCPAEPPGHP
ncbi:hypothetical protein [Streptomyces sp. NPDC000134]|uniref:hypothetical protein n=1 Tax=Streptomyces sp. NPDC000134 TaxID=3364536 RepID=UPI0036870476